MTTKWSKLWDQHLDRYVSTPPRTGYFVNYLFPNKKRILELGCGSARDSKHLAEVGNDVTATDFEKSLIDKLKKRSDFSALQLQAEDCTSLSFSNKQFDLSFQNGLIGLLSEESEKLAINEQLRVTSSVAIILVHNLNNKRLYEKFKRNKIEDAIYDVRFYDQKELIDLIRQSKYKNSKIEFKKFGGISDCFNHRLIRKCLPKRFHDYISRNLTFFYQLQPWSLTERIALIVYPNEA